VIFTSALPPGLVNDVDVAALTSDQFCLLQHAGRDRDAGPAHLRQAFLSQGHEVGADAVLANQQPASRRSSTS